MSTLTEGQKFERYRILRYLGSGISGESYEAEDTILLRKVTLKLIHPWSAMPDSARRQFFREMQIISRFNHPYLASVLDYGEIGSQLYVARRYISNGSLLGSEGRLWFRPPLAISAAVHHAHQLAQTLQYIHNHDYLHGSLTFSNILVLDGPNLDQEPNYAPFLLADVGLAHFVRRFGQPPHQLLPITAAPEQFGKRVVPASDQFALAVMLYFWLAGRPPYLGSPEEIEHQKLTESITPLSTFNGHTTSEQEAILFRALSVHPEDRYPSVLSFAGALLATLPSPLPPVPQTEPIIQVERAGSFEIIPATEPILETTLEPEPLPQYQLAASTRIVVESEGEPEFEPISHMEFTPMPETERLALLEPILSPQPGSIPETDPTISPEPEIEPGTTPEPGIAPTTEPGTEPETVPHILPEPTPQTVPGVPQPMPEPDVPQPSPDPIPQPRPDIPQPPSTPDFPQPSPDPIPRPEPDIPQPLPEPTIPQPSQPPLPQAKASPPEESVIAQEIPSNSQDEPAITTARLVITSPYTEEPYEFLLEGDEITLGRAGSSDVLLDQDNLTSRHHAVLKHEGERYLIYDRRSANGIFVNGHQISSNTGHELVDGDHISIGNYELIFRSSPLLSTISGKH